MIQGFPNPYYDEVFYSLAARYARQYSFPSHKTVLNHLFGTTSVIATVDFPTRLDAFSNRLPRGHPCCLPDLIWNHTMLPWYAPFLDPERVECLRQAMTGNGGRSTCGYVGLQRSRVRIPGVFRFCPECFREDWQTGRQLYWRRLHQMAGVDVCPAHEVFLLSSSVKRRNRITRHVFEMPDSNLKYLDSTRVSDTQKSLLQVAGLGQQLLNGTWPSLGSINLHRNLQDLLFDAGFGTLNGRVRLQTLIEALKEYYPGDFLNRMDRSPVEMWVPCLLHKVYKVQAPIRYLLLLSFLGLDLACLFGRPVVAAVSKPTFVCRNAVCPQLGKELEYTGSKQSRAVDGTVHFFRCGACGCIVARCAVGKERTWIHDYGPVWFSKLTDLWHDLTRSLRQIARDLGVDPQTVKRHAMKCGLQFPRVGRRQTTIRGLENMLEHKPDPLPALRQQWLVARHTSPDVGRTALRKRYLALYTLLYRKDRDWLMANQPPRVQNTLKRNRVDWLARDKKLKESLESAAFRLRNGPDMRQLTKTALLRQAGAAAWISKMAKLPESNEILKRICEDREQFARRRVAAVALRSFNNGLVIQNWEMEKQARLRPEIAEIPSVNNLVIQALEWLKHGAGRVRAT